MRSCFVVVALLLLTSCVSTNRPSGAQEPASGNTLSFITTVPARKAPPSVEEGKLFLMLGVIPGSIGGNPVEPRLAGVEISVGSSTKVDLERHKAQILEQIGHVDLETMGPEFRAEPVGLRFGRISNLLGVETEESSYTEAGFYELAKDIGIVLVYVDRPATFAGSTIEDGTTIEYAARLPSEGFHWLGFFPQAKNLLRVKHVEVEPRQVEFRLGWSEQTQPVWHPPTPD